MKFDAIILSKSYYNALNLQGQSLKINKKLPSKIVTIVGFSIKFCSKNVTLSDLSSSSNQMIAIMKKK